MVYSELNSQASNLMMSSAVGSLNPNAIDFVPGGGPPANPTPNFLVQQPPANPTPNFPSQDQMMLEQQIWGINDSCSNNKWPLRKTRVIQDQKGFCDIFGRIFKRPA